MSCNCSTINDTYAGVTHGTFDVQSIICLELHKKVTNSIPNVIEIANERVYGKHQLKNLKKHEISSVPGNAQESANGTTINVSDVCLMVQFSVHLIIHMEFHIKVHFKIHIKVHKKVHLMRLHLKVPSGRASVAIVHAIFSA